MRSHRLQQLADGMSVASSQTCCKLIVETCYAHCCAKLQQVCSSCNLLQLMFFSHQVTVQSFHVKMVLDVRTEETVSSATALEISKELHANWRKVMCILEKDMPSKGC